MYLNFRTYSGDRSCLKYFEKKKNKKNPRKIQKIPKEYSKIFINGHYYCNKNHQTEQLENIEC